MPIALMLGYQKSVDQHTPHLLRRFWHATGSCLPYFDETTGSRGHPPTPKLPVAHQLTQRRGWECSDRPISGTPVERAIDA